jgi:hypothetical protein
MYCLRKKQQFAVQFIRFICMHFSVKTIVYFEIHCCSSLNMIKLCSTKTSNEYLKDKRVFYNFELVTCLFEQVPPGPILTIEERENQLRIIISLK